MLAWTFSLVAVALGVTGVAGIVSFDAAEQRLEIGVRLALGASPAKIQRAFLARSLRLGIAGVVVGGLAALAAAGLLGRCSSASILPGPDRYAGVGLLVSSGHHRRLVLARARAAHVDPMTTLGPQ